MILKCQPPICLDYKAHNRPQLLGTLANHNAVKYSYRMLLRLPDTHQMIATLVWLLIYCKIVKFATRLLTKFNECVCIPWDIRVAQIMYCPLKLKNSWQAQNFLII